MLNDTEEKIKQTLADLMRSHNTQLAEQFKTEALKVWDQMAHHMRFVIITMIRTENALGNLRQEFWESLKPLVDHFENEAVHKRRVNPDDSNS